jgi:hypothetical protein
MNKLFLAVLAACIINIGPAIVVAQTAVEEEAEEQDYVSIRIDVYSKKHKTVAEDGSGLKLKLAISTALYRYRTLDELFDRDTEHINALGLRPKLEFEYLTPVKNVVFVPDLELAINESLDTNNKILAGAAQAAVLYRKNGDDDDFKVQMGVKYGTQYEQDGLNFDDYLETSLRIDLKPLYGFNMGNRRLTITPFGEIKNFIDDLEFETERGALFDIDRQYEIGFEFNTDPRKKFWGVALPRLEISYAFGDDFRGIKIRL